MKNKASIKKQILLTLLEKDTPVTVSELASITHVSGRSVRNYLKELQNELEERNIEIIKKPHVGVYLELSDEEKEKMLKDLEKYHITKVDYSLEYRRNYILKTLFKNKDTYTIQLLADDLYCSKSTIVNDLKYVEEWLENKSLSLKRKQNQGLWIEGDEKKYRRAIMDLFHEMKEKQYENNQEDTEELDYRIDYNSYKHIKNFFPRIDLYKIQAIIQETEEKLGYYFTDYAFVNLVTHITIAIHRVKNEKSVVLENIKFEDFKNKPQFEIAQWMLERLREEFKLNFPDNEAIFLLIHILGAKIQQHTAFSGLDYQKESQNLENESIAKEIINLVSQILNVNLTNDEVLLNSLIMHLKPTIFRLKNELKLRNPILNRVKKEYTSIFGAVWACSTIFEKKLGVYINEDEVGYIAMHIAAAIVRKSRQVRTIVLCSSGIGTSQLITTKLNRTFSEIDIVDTISINQLSEDVINKVDLIISTISNVKNTDKVIYVNALLGEDDINKIKRYINKFSKIQYKITNDAKSDSDKVDVNVLEEDLCFVDNLHDNFEDIINHYGKLMESKGYVTDGFCQNILEREKKGSTFIGNGISIPHASQEFVIKSKICIVKLPKEMLWQNNKINLIIILALKFTDINTTKRFFKNLYSILDNKELVERIAKTEDKLDIINIFNNGGITNV